MHGWWKIGLIIVDGWMNGWMDGWMDKCWCIYNVYIYTKYMKNNNENNSNNDDDRFDENIDESNDHHCRPFFIV